MVLKKYEVTYKGTQGVLANGILRKHKERFDSLETGVIKWLISCNMVREVK